LKRLVQKIKSFFIGTRVFPTDSATVALKKIFDTDLIDKVEVYENVGWLRLFIPWAAAATYRRRIWLRGSGLNFFNATSPNFMLHEYFHVLRQWEDGSMTLVKYLKECYRVGYWMNYYEHDAREFAAMNTYKYNQFFWKEVYKDKDLDSDYQKYWVSNSRYQETGLHGFVHPPKRVGYWVWADSDWHLYCYKKPSWFRRMANKLLLGMSWVENRK
jgi:hypothetical protein